MILFRENKRARGLTRLPRSALLSSGLPLIVQVTRFVLNTYAKNIAKKGEQGKEKDSFAITHYNLPVFAPIHVRLIQVSEKSEFILAMPDALQCAPPFPNRGLLFMSPVQFQTLLHLRHTE